MPGQPRLAAWAHLGWAEIKALAGGSSDTALAEAEFRRAIQIASWLLSGAACQSLPNFRLWLQGDIQPPEIDVCFAPKSGHSAAHAGLPLLTLSRSKRLMDSFASSA